MSDERTELEDQIGQWRQYVQRSQTIAPADATEMEDHLRGRIDDLIETGLAPDEAFLVAVKRMGSVDEISREFAREHAERLWKQLVLTGAHGAGSPSARRDILHTLVIAVLSAVAMRAALTWLSDNAFARSVPLLLLGFVAAYLVVKRGATVAHALLVATPVLIGAVALHLYPWADSRFDNPTEVLATLHLPVALWIFAVGLAYVGAEWRSSRRRMDFIRFTGEWVVYMALLQLGGGVLTAMTIGSFTMLGVADEDTLASWIVPMGAGGATVVAAWLVEAKQSVVENIAPVLTKIFTPLTVLMLSVLAVLLVVRLDFADVDRGLLMLMDGVLVLVLGLVLYAISARDPQADPGWFDRLQMAMLFIALVADAVLLVTMVTRIADAGFTANKVAALGLNLVVLVNLIWSTRLLAGFLHGRTPFAALERWQTTYLPVYGLWAAFVVLALPPIFGFT